ncbi:MAG: hypothetical protein WDL87_08280 [Candidatus Omnitrophota bacterium]
MKLKIIFFMVLVKFFYGSMNFSANAQDIPNIIVITISGVRNRDTIDSPQHEYIPKLWNELLPEGTLYTNLVNTNYGFHMPIVNAVNTGYSYHYFDWDSALKAPTIAQYVRKKYNLAENKAWVVGVFSMANCGLITHELGEDTFPASLITVPGEFSGCLEPILSSQDLFFFREYRALRQRKITGTFPQWDIASIQFKILMKILYEFKPKFVHYVMSNPEIAHADSYGRYLLSIEKADQQIYEIWNTLTSDKFYKGNTYLFVCVDSTREKYYKHHNADFLGGEPVWLYVFGPDVKKGERIGRKIYHADMFATFARIFKLNVASEGRVLYDSFIPHDR